MYEPFERFIKVSTWHTHHGSDEERFYLALNEVVRLSEFNPSAMTDYFRDYLGANASKYEDEIDRYERKAETIRSFLYEIGETER